MVNLKIWYDCGLWGLHFNTSHLVHGCKTYFTSTVLSHDILEQGLQSQNASHNIITTKLLLWRYCLELIKKKKKKKHTDFWLCP